MNHPTLLPLFFSAALASSALTACAPAAVHLDPRSVASVSLKLPTAEATFCPGFPFHVDVRAQLKDGSTCSTSDPTTTCMGQKGALIDAADVRLQGTAGTFQHGDGWVGWEPPRDALVTAERGLSLRGWIESVGQGAPVPSPVGEVELRPVYSCLQESVFTLPPDPSPGQNGRPGPDLKVSATIISTPFYPEALLVRVELSAGKTYILATDRSKPVTIYSKGQSGSPGVQGRNGTNGADGQPGSSRVCEAGKPGLGGTDGGAGGPGGNGGPGGMIQLFVDEALAPKIRGWLQVGSIGGDGGPAGGGGAGGQGGQGGHHSDIQTGDGCSAQDGPNGRTGSRGPDGDPGRPGLNGPNPTVAGGSRQTLFSDELPVIQRLDAAGRPRS